MKKGILQRTRRKRLLEIPDSQYGFMKDRSDIYVVLITTSKESTQRITCSQVGSGYTYGLKSTAKMNSEEIDQVSVFNFLNIHIDSMGVRKN